MQSPLVIDTWMLKLLARWSLCVIASAELLLWGRSCSENCSLLGVRCYYLGELCTWGVKCVCAAAIWSASAWTWSLLTPFSLVALHHGLFHHPALTEFLSWLWVLRVAELFTAVSGLKHIPSLSCLCFSLLLNLLLFSPRLEKPRPRVW